MAVICPITSTELKIENEAMRITARLEKSSSPPKAKICDTNMIAQAATRKTIEYATFIGAKSRSRA